MAQLKTYVLLPELDCTAPISMQISPTERIRLTKQKQWSPYLQITFVDEKDENKTIRLKLNSNTIDQDEQIEKKIDANVKFTDAERRAVKFHSGVLQTNNPIVQKFLESHPQFDGFKGYSEETKAYTIFDKTTNVRNANAETKRRLDAANAIYKLDVDGAEELLLSIFGATFSMPQAQDEEDVLAECQNILIKHIDEAPTGVDDVLNKNKSQNADDELAVLIGKAVTRGILSFDAIVDQVAMQRSGEWVPVKEISSTEYDVPERQHFLSEFLSTKEGAPLKADIEKAVEDFKKPTGKKPTGKKQK